MTIDSHDSVLTVENYGRLHPNSISIVILFIRTDYHNSLLFEWNSIQLKPQIVLQGPKCSDQTSLGNIKAWIYFDTLKFITTIFSTSFSEIQLIIHRCDSSNSMIFVIDCFICNLTFLLRCFRFFAQQSCDLCTKPCCSQKNFRKGCYGSQSSDNAQR